MARSLHGCTVDWLQQLTWLLGLSIFWRWFLLVCWSRGTRRSLERCVITNKQTNNLSLAVPRSQRHQRPHSHGHYITSLQYMTVGVERSVEDDDDELNER